MSYQEPAASGYTQTASELDPKHYAVVPSDAQQDLAFRSIRAINPTALTPYGSASHVPERRTAKGVRPMIWVRLNETRSAIVFEVTLHTNQCVQVHVPLESWRLATCEPEAVRAAIQKAYLNLLRRKPDPVVVKPGMISLKLMPPPGTADRSSSAVQASRQNSYESNTTNTSLGSSRHSSSRHQRSNSRPVQSTPVPPLPHHARATPTPQYPGYYDPYTGYVIQYQQQPKAARRA